jgi:hypothetical protein
MSRRRVLLVTLPILVLLPAAATIATIWFGQPKKTRVTIEVSGTPGLAIKGTCEVDGQPREETFTGSKELVLEGHRVIYSLVSTDDSGEFRVRPRVGDQALMSGGSGNPPKQGIRGWVKSSWWGAPPAHWFEPFDRDEQPKWLKPPP